MLLYSPLFFTIRFPVCILYLFSHYIPLSLIPYFSSLVWNWFWYRSYFQLNYFLIPSSASFNDFPLNCTISQRHLSKYEEMFIFSSFFKNQKMKKFEVPCWGLEGEPSEGGAGAEEGGGGKGNHTIFVCFCFEISCLFGGPG